MSKVRRERSVEMEDTVEEVAQVVKTAEEDYQERCESAFVDLLRTVEAICGRLSPYLTQSGEFVSRCREVTDVLRRGHPQITFPALICKG